MKKVLALMILSLASLASLGLAQTPPAKPAPAAPAPAAPAAKAAPATELEKKVDEVSRLVQAGKTAEALQRLQALEKDPATPPPVHALAGVLYLELGKPQEALAVLKPLADPEDAQPAVLYQAGRAALALGKRDVAKVYFTRSVLKEPASPAARELGLLTAQDGKVVEAYSMLHPWALRNPTDADARLMAANLALTLERPDEAAEMLVGQPENDPAIRLLQGRVRVQKKDGPGAVVLLQPLLANHPKGMDLELRRDLAEAQMLAGKPAEAVALLQGRTQGHPALVLALARAQRQAGDAAAAMATLQPVAAKIPADPEVLGDPRPAAAIALEYGSLLLDAGRAVEALPFLDKAARYNQRSAEAWKTLARGLDANGKKEAARNARARAEEVSRTPVRIAVVPAASLGAAAAGAAAASPGPATPQAQQVPISPAVQNALTLMSKGQLDGALASVRQEIGLSNDPQARLLEVRILLTQKKSAEALKAAEAALKTDPNNPDYIYLRGAVEMSLQQYSAAEVDLRKALELSPRHTGAMSDLAVLLMNVNKKDEARRLLKEVLEINPQDKNAAANLHRLDAEARQ
jgi:tetratricopeptide (TPR) repeat protein